MPAPRRLLLAAAALSVAALALSSCTAGPSSDDGGEVVWAIEGANLSEGHMDPQTSQLDVSAMVQRAVLDSLVFQEADGSFSPWLATDWEIRTTRPSTPSICATTSPSTTASRSTPKR